MSDPVRVVLHPRHPRGVDAAFRAIGDIELIEPDDEDGVIDALDTSPVLVSFRWSDRFLTDALQWIQSISAGVDQFPLEDLASRGIRLTSARGVHGPAAAEHAFALLLALTRAVGVSMRDAEHRRWRPRMGVELGGATMGILGLGSIGEEIAVRAVAWGMTVIGTKANPDAYEGAASEVLGPDGTVEVFGRSDVVVSVLPDTPGTEGIVDDTALSAMEGGWFVNVGRGTAVDEDALIRAIDGGHLLGAGLDVFCDHSSHGRADTGLRTASRRPLPPEPRGVHRVRSLGEPGGLISRRGSGSGVPPPQLPRPRGCPAGRHSGGDDSSPSR